MLPLLLLLALPIPLESNPAAGSSESFAWQRDERADHRFPGPRELEKKELWRREKAYRPSVRIQPFPEKKEREKRAGGLRLAGVEAILESPPPQPGQRVLPLATLFNQWTREAYPVLPGQPHRRRFQLFLRDHFTQQPTQVDHRLFYLLVASAQKFQAQRVEVVSGYRAPKYNLMLRKKGRQVAKESQHTQGTAVDFRVYGAKTESLRDFVRAQQLGGVGYYPVSRFVHADTGKIRTWKGR